MARRVPFRIKSLQSDLIRTQVNQWILCVKNNSGQLAVHQRSAAHTDHSFQENWSITERLRAQHVHELLESTTVFSVWRAALFLLSIKNNTITACLSTSAEKTQTLHRFIVASYRVDAEIPPPCTTRGIDGWTGAQAELVKTQYTCWQPVLTAKSQHPGTIKKNIIINIINGTFSRQTSSKATAAALCTVLPHGPLWMGRPQECVNWAPLCQHWMGF